MPIILAAVLYGAGCGISREDIFTVISTPQIPAIEIAGYPDGTGYHDYGSVDVYTTVAAVFTIANTGTGNLKIKGISFVEKGITEFSVDTPSFRSVVPPSGSTTFSVVFKPTDAAFQTCTVNVTSNDPENPEYTFSVQGTGTGLPAALPDINVRHSSADIPSGAPTPIEFGVVETGTPSSLPFVIENKGPGDLSVFSVEAVPGGGTAEGEFSALAPSIPAQLAQDESVVFTVMFIPRDTGFKSAEIDITSDDPDAGENPYTFTVQGTGSPSPEPDINLKRDDVVIPNSTGTHDFGFIKTDTLSTPAEFTILNEGTAPLDIVSVVPVAGDTDEFIVDTAGTSPALDPGTETYFHVTFSPDATAGPKSALIHITSNDLDENPYEFQVTGVAVETAIPDISVEDAPAGFTYDFGAVLLGDSKTVLFTIANSGTANLSGVSVVNKDPGSFTLDATETASLVTPGGDTTFKITFTPANTKMEGAKIEIASNDPDTDPYKFRVEAYGTTGPPPDILVTVEGVFFPNDFTYYLPDTPKETASDPVVFDIENRGLGSLVLQSILLTIDIESFDIDYEDNLTVGPGGSLPVTVLFIPHDVGKYKAKLEIKSNDPEEKKYLIKLEGYGI